MASDPIFQHLIQELFPYSYGNASHSSLIISQKFTPKRLLTKNLFDLMVEAFAVLEIVIHETFSAYLGKNRAAMKQSAESYVYSTMCICWMKQQVVPDIYDRFLSTIVLVRYTTERLFSTNGKKFYKLTSQILTVLFENTLREDFMKRGGWENLGKHILNKKYREHFNEYARYDFISHLIPEDLKLKNSLLVTSTTGLSENIPCEWINYLTLKVMSSVSTSLLKEINSPKLDKEKTVSKEIEGSRSTNTLEDSEMPPSSKTHNQLCVSRIDHLEEKVKELISIFELLESLS
ncbi:uncharacterized protein TNCT_625791 [Trichonephila clavata]|uniref:Uncharacterized protein n=1 Tax=Trichonephila clavata TaxID=2740835 RepID=A0A8X6M1X5_TRICU|nr:uncharacterized protein TNCT_625791 [Trichonephila clavata]